MNWIKNGLVLLMLLSVLGCKSIPQDDLIDLVGVVTNLSGEASQATNVTAEVVQEPELNWCYGGANGSRAVVDSRVVIKSCSMQGYLMTFVCDSFQVFAPGTDPNSDDAPVLFCVFYKNDEGKWVGGKMDWIRLKNRTRPLGVHCYGKGGPTYKEGASWQWVPPPGHAELACCLMTKDLKFRSNLAFCVGP